METGERAAAAPIDVGIDVGIAVSTTTLDVAMRPRAAFWGSPKDAAGRTKRVGRLRPRAPLVIGREATGGRERRVVAALALAGLALAVVTAPQGQGRDFATATGRLAKTDALAAAGLVPLAAAIRPAPHPLLDAASQACAALGERRRQRVGGRTAQRTRAPQALPPVRPPMQTPPSRLPSTGGSRRSSPWKPRWITCCQPARSGAHASTSCAAGPEAVPPAHSRSSPTGPSGARARLACHRGRSATDARGALQAPRGGRAPPRGAAPLLCMTGCWRGTSPRRSP